MSFSQELVKISALNIIFFLIVPMSDREINHVDDEDSEIEGSSDGPLEI